MQNITVGILAHVDSGKTTLSEAMLYVAGAIRKFGRVDHKNAFLDTYKLEKDRGITIFSKQAVFSIGDKNFTLLDTPGHIDFSAETERTLRVLDYAVLVINGAEGIRNYTETLWKLLSKYNIPTFIFINKMDMTEYTKPEILKEIRKKFSENCIDFSENPDLETIASCDEKLMNEFFDTDSISENSICKAISERKIFPCCYGSALKMYGTEEFIGVLEKYTLMPKYGNRFGARVFKISSDEQGNRLTYMKITGGELKVKSSPYENSSEKVNQIRIYSGAKYKTVESVKAGEICAVTGLSDTYAMQGMGFEENFGMPVLEPVMNYTVKSLNGTEINKVLEKMRILEEEEPLLNIAFNEQCGEINVKLMGEVQLEILKSIMKERFGMEIDFGSGSIAYKETIKGKSEGVGHYEPLRHYAEVHLILEELPTGSGLVFETNCREDDLARNWQRLILTHMQEKVHIGVLTGSPITDMKITLVSGKAHLKHTEGGDFRQAVYRAIRHGLAVSESVLLEPWYNFTLEVPSENAGRAMNDIQLMGGKTELSDSKEGMSIIRGSVPVSEINDYQNEVNSYTHGKGKLSYILKGYYPCHNTEKVISEYGYDFESDLENSPDSVFCTHGAGYVVKWSEVTQHMHLESVLKTPKAESIPEPTEVRNYCRRLADDDELMKIFERTYGKPDTDIRKSFRTKRQRNIEDENKAKPVPVAYGKEYLLVDGYNIIFGWKRFEEYAKDNLNLARNRLIDIMCNYKGFKQCEVIVVFDAYKVKGGKRSVERVCNIDVVYTKEAETADMYIEKVTNEMGRKHRVRVATSDNLEQIIILGNGAYRISASEFEKEVESVEEAIREYLS